MDTQITLVASTWLIVRILRPWLSTGLRLVHLPEIDGEGVWLLVALAAMLTVSLADQTLSTPELLRQALAVTAAAIGADNVVKESG